MNLDSTPKICRTRHVAVPAHTSRREQAINLPPERPRVPTLAEIVSATTRDQQTKIKADLHEAVSFYSAAAGTGVGNPAERKGVKALVKGASDLLARATELYRAGPEALSKVGRLDRRQTTELFTKLFQAREEFWKELHAVPFVARQRVRELTDFVGGTCPPGLMFHARSDTRTSAELRAAAKACVESFSKLERKSSGDVLALKRCGIPEMLVRLPPVPELLLERGSEVKRRTERLIELEARMLCRNGSLSSKQAERDPSYGEYQLLRQDLGGGALHARQQLSVLEASRRPYQALKDYLYLANIGLSRSFRSREVEQYARKQDLYQGAALGLLKAIERYAPESGNSFSTCASNWVRQSLDEARRLSGSVVVIPAHMTPAFLTIRGAASGANDEQLMQEVSSYYGIDRSTLDSLARLSRGFVSLENSQRDSDVEGRQGDMLEDPSSDIFFSRIFEKGEIDQALAALDQLSPRYRAVVRARLGLENGQATSLADLARSMGVTKERARQIYIRALEKLRQILERQGVIK